MSKIFKGVPRESEQREAMENEEEGANNNIDYFLTGDEFLQDAHY